MAIDLHTHTNESDGALSPLELMLAAERLGLEAIAITDHDTFAGWDRARAEYRGPVELACGIELSTRGPRLRGRGPISVHLLGYFLHGGPPPEFREWLAGTLRYRRERNAKLASRLRELGINITLDEVEALGRSLTGRPHFARLLVRKGYAANTADAFDRYLGESGAAYVVREEPATERAVAQIAASGGVAALAHPIRFENEIGADFEGEVVRLKQNGLRAIEVWHTDHAPQDSARYLALARRLGLAPTGGTDFHGDSKPDVKLGTGRGSISVPLSVLDELKALA